MQETIGAAVRPLTVEDFHAMGEAGILAEGERVELLEGMLVTMAPIGPAHNLASAIAPHYLRLRLGEAAAVTGAVSLIAGPLTELQPDAVILRPTGLKGKPRYWVPADVMAVIEIAGSSLSYDARDKAQAYARGSFLEYLVLDVKNERLIRHRGPALGGYKTIESLGRGDRFALDALPAIELEVERFFSLSPEGSG